VFPRVRRIFLDTFKGIQCINPNPNIRTTLDHSCKSAIGVSEASNQCCDRFFSTKPRRVDTIFTSPLQVNRHKKVHASINIISIKQQKQAMTITPKISRGLRVLQPPKKEDVQAEKDELMKEIALIEQWWREPRWKGTTRTYSGQIFLMFDVLDVDDGCMLL
jgi:hypothetical protein